MKVLKCFLIIFMVVVFMGMSRRPPAPTPPETPAEVGVVSIIFENGLFVSTRNWNALMNYLEDRGYRRDFMFPVTVIDNYLMCSTRHIEQLEDQIDTVRSVTGLDTVILIGHSRGGTVLANFMHLSPDAELVSDVIMLAGVNMLACSSWPGEDMTPSDALYTSIYSPDDGTVPITWSIVEGAMNISVDNVNHMTFPSNQQVMELVVEAIENGGYNN